jgi:hypothetical protein
MRERATHMHYVGGQNYSLLWERERERERDGKPIPRVFLCSLSHEKNATALRLKNYKLMLQDE